ncbi:MAG TPA: response regulator [Magnetovibrio sp.]
MSRTVLIVEDDSANRFLMETVLSGEGYAVVSSIDGSDALDLARTHKPGVVLMDINLPKVKGTERIRQFKADPELAHIPIIAVTTQVMKGDEEDIRNSGCQDYVSKPFEISVLLAAIERLYFQG